MKYIADPRYNGTIERAIALQLDHHLITAGLSNAHILRNPQEGMDGLVDAIAESIKARTSGLTTQLQQLVDHLREENTKLRDRLDRIFKEVTTPL